MSIHVALMGLSHPHGAPYLETLRSLESVEAVSVWDADPHSLAELEPAAEGKIRRVTGDAQEILEDESIRAALVALPTKHIPEMTRRFLQRGRHVLAEKPGAAHPDDWAPLVEEAEQRRLVLGVSYPWRCHPLCLKIRELVESGVLGQIRSVEARWIASQVRFRNPDLWLFKRELAGGGILAWLGCHWVDLLRFLTGDEVSEVSCVTARGTDRIDVEDSASLAIRLSAGAVGTIRTGYHLAISPEGYVGGRYDMYLALSGTEGAVRWEPRSSQASHLLVESTRSGWEGERSIEHTPEQAPGYVGAMGRDFVDAFVRAAQGDGSVPADGRDGLHTLRVLDAAYASNESRRRIALAGAAG